jgi:AcrR family transcriptional regulator
MHKLDKRQTIMLAAERMFTSRRFHEITMEDVARAAGVGKGTIYGYFQTKDDLFFETATAGFDELCELLRRRVPEAMSFREKLLRASREIHAFFVRRRPLFRMMQAEHSRMLLERGRFRDHWMEQRRKLVSAVAEIFEEGIAAGAIRGDVAPEVLTHFFLGMLRTCVLDLADVPGGAAPHDLVVKLFCNGAALNLKTAEGVRSQESGVRSV